MISNLKDKLQTYYNRDHVSVKSKQYCEGLEADIVSLKVDLEKSNKKNKKLLRAFYEQDNGI